MLTGATINVFPHDPRSSVFVLRNWKTSRAKSRKFQHLPLYFWMSWKVGDIMIQRGGGEQLKAILLVMTDVLERHVHAQACWSIASSLNCL